MSIGIKNQALYLLSQILIPATMEFMEGSFVHIAAEVVTTLILFIGGYLIGKFREKRLQKGRNLDEYDFYPFHVNKDNFPEFSLNDFRLGMYYFLKNSDYTAARQLIFMGEQNRVRELLGPADLRQYEKLYKKYDGKKIEDDTSEFLENYRNIVRLFGQTFQHMGIEILLHNLMNPARSIEALENEVTGRRLHNGATNLVIDLKKRRMIRQDKLNYELVIGSRKFKCTTVPILRNEYGIVGAVCINIDVNYISDVVLKEKDKLEEFFRNYTRTEMQLEENILSREEYEKALKGKRHWAALV